MGEEYKIGIASGVDEAVQMLNGRGIVTKRCAEGVQVALPEADLMAAIDFLTGMGIHTGLVKAASLEDTFQKVVQEADGRVE